MAGPIPQHLSIDYLASDSLYEQEVLKLSDGDTEEDLNRRLVQTAEDVGMSDHEIALCLGPHLVPATMHTAPSITSTAVNSPNSRGSLNTSSTAHTSNYSFAIDEPRTSTHSPTHRRNISISNLFGQTRGQPSLDSTGPDLSDSHQSKKGLQHFSIRDMEINILNGKGLGKISRRLGLRKNSRGEAEPIPWQAEPSPMDPVKYSTGGIHAGLAGRIDVKPQTQSLMIEQPRWSSRAPSVNTEAGDRLGFRSRSAAFMRKKGNRRSLGIPSDLNGKAAWSQPGSSTNLVAVDFDRPLPPLPLMPTMGDELQTDDASMALAAMLASSPYANPEPARQEMRDALRARAGLQVQSQNRTELRKLKAFRNKQLRALEILHENERNKTLSVFDQQQELIDAKYRQALMHLVEDRQVSAELDLLAQLDERLKREQGKLRHMEAYCSPASGRIVTSQNLALLDAQRSLVDQLQSEQYSTASLNHLREKQDNDAARLPKHQAVELEELEEKRGRAVLAREDIEQQESRRLNAIIRRRREASVARCNLRLEIWRRRYEGEALKPLPGPLPYFRSEFVFDARWMVDIPVRSALDNMIPENRVVAVQG